MALTRISGNNLILYLGSDSRKTQGFEHSDGSFVFSGLASERLPIAYSDNLSVTLDKNVIDTNNKSELGFRSIVPVINSMSINTSAFILEQAFRDVDYDTGETVTLKTDTFRTDKQLIFKLARANSARSLATKLTKDYSFGLAVYEFYKDPGSQSHQLDKKRLKAIIPLITTAQATATGSDITIRVNRSISSDEQDYIKQTFAGVHIFRIVDTESTKFDASTLTPADIKFLRVHRVQKDLDRYWSGDTLLHFEFGLGYDRWIGSGYVTNYNISTAVNDVAKVTLDIEADEHFRLANVSPFSLQLGYDATEFDAAVQAYERANTKLYYRQTTRQEYHQTGNRLYVDASKKTLAAAGFYADAGNVRRWSGTAWVGENKTRA